MPKEVIVCRCDCGCGRVTRETHPTCPLCLENKHPSNPLPRPKDTEMTECGDCHGFMYFDKKAKMFKCGPFCYRRGVCD
jgi:hypothetical protein